ncbi:MAG: hypothetical protein ACJ8AO_20250, partial [Gemmatimonadaceae bacterium]
EAEAIVRAVERRCKGRRVETEAGPEWRGCGADFNAEILARPLDGAVRTVTCPNCGQVIEYRAPRFALSDEG